MLLQCQQVCHFNCMHAVVAVYAYCLAHTAVDDEETSALESQTADIHAVHVRVVNPKALTQSELYGSFDKNTHEWSDGVLAVIVRQFARDTSRELKWVVFDGPVDAAWVEVRMLCNCEV
jgi:hypothetical protein